MKKITSLFIAMIFCITSASAQWCIPTVTPYLGCPSMPGISNVTFNTINHSSPTCESPTSNYVNTGESTTVEQGSTYPFSMTFNIDPVFDTTMNLRVWIDWDIDHSFSPSETVISMNYQTPGTYSGSITVPTDAKVGTTRMRVTSKMTSNGGHTLPTPCNMPPDPIDYHGGVEDYTLVVTAPTKVKTIKSNFVNLSIAPNPVNEKSVLRYSLNQASEVSALVYNIQGRRIISLFENKMQATGKHSFSIEHNALEAGIYFVHLKVNGVNTMEKFIVLN